MTAELTLRPDPHVGWIYDPAHPDYSTEHAESLRTARAYALNSLPRWALPGYFDESEQGGKS